MLAQLKLYQPLEDPMGSGMKRPETLDEIHAQLAQVDGWIAGVVFAPHITAMQFQWGKPKSHTGLCVLSTERGCGMRQCQQRAVCTLLDAEEGTPIRRWRSPLQGKDRFYPFTVPGLHRCGWLFVSQRRVQIWWDVRGQNSELLALAPHATDWDDELTDFWAKQIERRRGVLDNLMKEKAPC